MTPFAMMDDVRAIFFVFIAIFLLPLFTDAQGFTKNLYFGMRNNQDVVRLQNFLRDRDYFTYPQSTGNYFTQTLQAVRNFQKDNGISPVGGYFGPQSRVVANRLLGSGEVEQPPKTTGKGPATIPSPYKKKIVIGSILGTSEDPLWEQITLENRTEKEKVNITGWIIENSRGFRFEIPKGHELPGFEVLAQDQIVLKPGDRVVVTSGRQDARMDFRQNICTGYLDETSVFQPALSRQCPRPETRRLLNLSDRCLQLIDATPSCRQFDFRERVDSDCSQYINQNLNYSGCVRNYKNRKDFYSNEWFIWMQRNTEFFRNERERVVLKDNAARVVDEYNY